MARTIDKNALPVERRVAEAKKFLAGFVLTGRDDVRRARVAINTLEDIKGKLALAEGTDQMAEVEGLQQGLRVKIDNYLEGNPVLHLSLVREELGYLAEILADAKLGAEHAKVFAARKEQLLAREDGLKTRIMEAVSSFKIDKRKLLAAVLSGKLPDTVITLNNEEILDLVLSGNDVPGVEFD